jgi:hypothetical protein
VTVKIAGATVPTATGSYCWSSGGYGECADMASIEAVIQAGGLSPIRVLANSPGTISFDRRPKSMDLMVGSDEARLNPPFCEDVTCNGVAHGRGLLAIGNAYRYHHEVPITAGQSECREHLPGPPAGPGFGGRPGQTVEAWLLKYECQANTTPSARAKRPMIRSTNRAIRRSVM